MTVGDVLFQILLCFSYLQCCGKLYNGSAQLKLVHIKLNLVRLSVEKQLTKFGAYFNYFGSNFNYFGPPIILSKKGIRQGQVFSERISSGPSNFF